MADRTKTKILLAEEDFHSRQLLAKVLSGYGFQVVAAENGAEALQILRSDAHFDLVISDWETGRLDGLELCSEIKSDDRLRRIYFILLSSRSLSGDKVTALNAGVDDCLAKPCDPEELLARIRAGLRIRDLQDEILHLEKKMAVLQLATAAGHEINNPLTIIIGFLELLREAIESGDPPEALLKYIDPMTHQAKRIEAVVAKLISLTEIRTKRYLGDHEMVDLDQNLETR